MAWSLNNSRPIYQQLMEHIQRDIITGVYQPGEKIPAVRDLALTAAVNPNTMQKALTELERTNLIYTHRTTGRYVTEDLDLLLTAKQEVSKTHLKEFVTQMKLLQFTSNEILEATKLFLNEEE